MNKLGVKAGEVLFVGDNLVLDIMGSQDAGMTGVWFNPSMKINETDIKPAYEICALKNILELIN